jgi:hypothetical protein
MPTPKRPSKQPRVSRAWIAIVLLALALAIALFVLRSSPIAR